MMKTAVVPSLLIVVLVFAAVVGCGRSGNGNDTADGSLAERERKELLEKLGALGYVGHVRKEAHHSVGVVRYDKGRASRGVTVFGNRRGAPEAYMFDMEGNELYSWKLAPARGGSLLWMEPTGDGNLLALGRGYLVKMDWTGTILWETEPMRFHHGFSQDVRGQIYAMASRWRKLRHAGKRVPIKDDYLAVLSPAGKLIKEISMLDLLGKYQIPPAQLDLMVQNADEKVVDKGVLEDTFALDHPFDFPHLNSAVVIDRDIGVADKGHLLICLRSLDLVLIIDPEQERIVWQWTEGQGELDRPHRPWLLENNNILIFDNGWRRGFSRVLELDPRVPKIVWEYTAEPKESFFTRRGGMAQPLPGGNLLITEADKGHLFEITRTGEIVWSFWNPKFKENGKRQTIYRAWRWTGDDLRPEILGENLERKLASQGYLD